MLRHQAPITAYEIGRIIVDMCNLEVHYSNIQDTHTLHRYQRCGLSSFPEYPFDGTSRAVNSQFSLPGEPGIYFKTPNCSQTSASRAGQHHKHRGAAQRGEGSVTVDVGRSRHNGTRGMPIWPTVHRVHPSAGALDGITTVGTL
jgi:hypothetical protein